MTERLPLFVQKLLCKGKSSKAFIPSLYNFTTSKISRLKVNMNRAVLSMPVSSAA